MKLSLSSLLYHYEKTLGKYRYRVTGYVCPGCGGSGVSSRCRGSLSIYNDCEECGGDGEVERWEKIGTVGRTRKELA
jgi:DnaJ-class molecular chaperone